MNSFQKFFILNIFQTRVISRATTRLDDSGDSKYHMISEDSPMPSPQVENDDREKDPGKSSRVFY